MDACGDCGRLFQYSDLSRRDDRYVCRDCCIERARPARRVAAAQGSDGTAAGGMAWQELGRSLDRIVILSVQYVAHLSCHRIEFRDEAGDYVIQIDDRQLYDDTLTERQREVWQAAARERERKGK